MEPQTPRANTLSSQASNLDDLFEGEPDLGFLFTPSSHNLHAVAAWLKFRDSGAEEMQIATDEQHMLSATGLSAMAHGGLGDGDTPYGESMREQRHETLTIPTCVDVDLPTASEPGIRELPSLAWTDCKMVDEWVRKKAHPANLKGEVFDQHVTDCTTNDYDVYSATGSTESISAYADETFPALGDEDSEDAPFRIPQDQARSVQPAFPSPVEEKCREPLENHQFDDDTFIGPLNSNVIHSALWHSKPYLSEFLPADTQGHHPSTITLSAHSNASRSSSLVEELLVTEETQLPSGICPEEKQFLHVDFNVSEETTPAVNMETIHSKTLSLVKYTENPPEDAHSPAPLRVPISSIPASSTLLPSQQSDMKPPHVTGSGSAAARLVDGTGDSIDANILPPNVSDLSFQYDNTRSTPLLQGSIVLERGPAQEKLQSTSNQNATGCQTGRRVCGKPEEDISHNPWTESQVDSATTEVVVSIMSAPVQSPNALDCSSQNDPLYGDAMRAHDRPEPDRNCMKGTNASEDSAVMPTDVSSPYPPPLAASEQTSSTSPSPSPLARFEGGIRLAKRGSRKATTSRKTVVKDTNPRVDATSAALIKCKGTAKSKNAPMVGIQGESNKITKTVRTKSARIASRKINAVVKAEKGFSSGIPNVPKLLDSMDLDLPNLQLQSNITQGLRQAHVGKLLALEACQLRTILPTTVDTNMNDDVEQEQDTLPGSQLSSNKPGISSQTIEHQLEVHNTKRPAKSDLTASGEKTATPDNDRLSAIITQMSDQTSAGTDTHLAKRRPFSPSSQRTATHDKPGPFMLSPIKRPKVRTSTPYRVQKLILRPPRMPVPVPPIIAAINTVQSELNSPSDLPITKPTVQLPELAIARGKPKPKATPRKATPAARKGKQPGSGFHKSRHAVSEDVIPPVPPIPTTPTRRLTGNSPTEATNTPSALTAIDVARLTPQSAERMSATECSLSHLPTPAT